MTPPHVKEVIKMSERYVDPNSGAAPQPGGFAAVAAATDEGAKAPAEQVKVDKQEEKPQEKTAGRRGAPGGERS